MPTGETTVPTTLFSCKGDFSEQDDWLDCAPSSARIRGQAEAEVMRLFELVDGACTVEAWACAPGNLPKRLVFFHETLRSLLILLERRPERRYKRHVKIKMSNFKRKPGKPVAKGSK